MTMAYFTSEVEGMEEYCQVEMTVFESPEQVSERTQPLESEEWQRMMDLDGRIINETELRKAVFKGRIEYVVLI